MDFYYYRNKNTVKKNNTRDSPRFFYAALHIQVIFAREEKKGKPKWVKDHVATGNFVLQTPKSAE